MVWQFTPYMLLLVASAVLPCLLALLVLRRPAAPGARVFVFLMLSVAAWSSVYCMELASADASMQIAWHRLAFIVGDIVPIGWLLFAVQYAGGQRARWLTSGPRIALLGIDPLISLLLIGSGDPFSLVWTRLWQDTSGPFAAVRAEPGPWLWVDTAFCYGLVLWGTGMVFRALLRSRRLYRMQASTLIIGVLIPWVADLVTNLAIGPLPQLDLTPMSCSVTCVIFAWGFFRFHFLDVMPVARDVVFERLGDPVVVLDALNRIVDLNPAAARVLNIDPTAATGAAAPDVLVGWPELIYTTSDAEQTSAEVTLAGETGPRAFDLQVSALHRGKGRLGGRLVVLRDITERKHLAERLAHQAFHDALTGLANRAHFQDRLAEAFQTAQTAHAARTPESAPSTRLGVLFLDLDDFKTVNDSLGHAAGDRLLVEIGQRIRGCLGPHDTAGRLGGDEFALLVPDCASVDDLVKVAERVLRSLEEPVVVAERELRVRASIGIAAADETVSSPDDLLRDADLALYAAKARGKARYAVFDTSMERNALERLELESALRCALERGEFRVFYQPIVALDDGRIVEVEALVRWEHPQRGLIGPGAFVPLAEETGLIVPLGQYVLESACRQARSWQTRYAAARDLVVSVNLSARQFQHPRLLTEIDRTLVETGLSPAQLKLEITETVAMQDADSTAATLDRLKALGIQVAIDDFGTGYSSLSYLKRFPVDALKIDRSFVDGLGDDDQDTAIVQTIVALARALDVGVTAEGIETERQRRHLAVLGCGRGQGYLFSRPVPAQDLEDLLVSGGRRRAALAA